MRIALLSAVALLTLSACSKPERTDQGQHADAVEQPATAPAPAAGNTAARNVPGGGSGTAASAQQDSGAASDAAPPPPKR